MHSSASTELVGLVVMVHRFLHSGGVQFEFCGGSPATLTKFFFFLPLQANSRIAPQLCHKDFLPNSMISCYIFIDSENIIKLTTKIHMKIVFLNIMAHISIPVYVMHSK